MALVFSNSTYQHMVNTSKTKINIMQNNVANQLDCNLFGTSICVSDIVSTNAKSPKQIVNWSLILDEFLPRNEAGTNQASIRRKSYQYKPAVLRNKTPFGQLTPEILPPHQYNSGDETNIVRVSKAYTLPQDTETDIHEIMPTGDSSINDLKEALDELPLYRIMLNKLKEIFLKSCQMGYSNFGITIQVLTTSLNFLYDFIINIVISLRLTIPNILTRLKQCILVEPIAILWRQPYLNKPLLHSNTVYLAMKKPSEQNLQCQSIEESLSRSAIVSFGRYCNFMPLNGGKLKR